MTALTLRCPSPMLQRWHDVLRKDGVSPTAINAGYAVARAGLNPFKAERQAVGAGDTVIDCAEIAEVIFTRWQQYRELIAKDTGRPIPWEIRDPVILEKVARIRASVGKLWPFDSPMYKEQLGYALYFYAAMPNPARMAYFRKIQPTWLDTVGRPLRIVGLDDVVDGVVQEGGLGLMQFEKDAALEATAEEALKLQNGLCTERTKILHALFTKAGLSPVIYLMTVQQADRAWTDFFGGKIPFIPSPDEEFSGHVALGLETSAGQFASYDFQPFAGSGLLVDIPFEKYAIHISLREFFQVDLANLALNRDTQHHPEQARVALQTAEGLGESYFSPQMALQSSEFFLKQKNLRAAKTAIQAGLGLVPNDPRLQSWLCKILNQEDLLAEATACYTKVADLMLEAKVTLADLHLKQGNNDQAIRLYEEIVQRGYKVAEVEEKLGQLYLQKKDAEKALIHFKTAADRDPGNPGLQIQIAGASVALNLRLEALVAFKRALLLEKDDQKRFKILADLSQLLAGDGQLPLARHYFARLLRTGGYPRTDGYVYVLRTTLTMLAEKSQALDLLSDYWLEASRASDSFLISALFGAFSIETAWRGNFQKQAFVAAKVSQEYFKKLILEDPVLIHTNPVRRMDEALSTLPTDFWRKAPPVIVDFNAWLGRFYEDYEEKENAVRTYGRYLKYTKHTNPTVVRQYKALMGKR